MCHIRSVQKKEELLELINNTNIKFTQGLIIGMLGTPSHDLTRLALPIDICNIISNLLPTERNVAIVCKAALNSARANLDNANNNKEQPQEMSL